MGAKVMDINDTKRKKYISGSIAVGSWTLAVLFCLGAVSIDNALGNLFGAMSICMFAVGCVTIGSLVCQYFNIEVEIF